MLRGTARAETPGPRIARMEGTLAAPDCGSLRTAIVGYGAAAHVHLAAYETRKDVVVSAVVDPCPARRAAARARLPRADVYATVADLDERELDFLDVCAPPYAHRAAIVSGLASGRHVICEKPLVVGLDAFSNVVDALRASRGVLFPAHNYKFAPFARRMRETIAADEFGEVVAGRFRTLRTRNASGVPEWRPNWRRDATVAGGGILQDHAPHAVYLSVALTGRVPRWTACTTRPAGDLRGNEEAVFVTIGLDGGATIDVELTWTARARHTSYSIVGSRESVFSDETRFVHRTANGTLETTRGCAFDYAARVAWFSRMFDDFQDLIASPQRQDVLLAEAFWTTAVIESAYASAASGGIAVKVPRLSSVAL